MRNRTRTSIDREADPRRDAADGMRPCGYVAPVAHLIDVGAGSSSRRASDPRIDAVGVYLAAVHSMPLHRLVELVSRAIARRARNGEVTRGRATHRSRGRPRRSAGDLYLGPIE